MRLFSLFFILIVSIVNAQTEADYCGARLSDRQKNWLKAFQQNPQTGHRETTDMVYVPIQFHILGTDEGQGYFAENMVYSVLCKLNMDFEPVGIQFYHPNAFNYINNSDWYIHEDLGLGGEMMNENNVNDRINVYFVDNPAGNCGYYIPGPDAIALNKSCSEPDSTTPTHEMGHYMSMPHTFNGWEYADSPWWNLDMAENVARSGPYKNCDTNGDEFCDTPADYIPERWNCPYNLIQYDPTGKQLHTDGRFYMSYSNDNCRDRFSEEQKQAMISYMYDIHPELMDNNPPIPEEELVATTTVFPAHQAVNIAPGQVILRWTAVAGTDKYHVMIQNTGSGSPISYYEVTDTFKVVETQPNTIYFWRVKPYHRGDYCAPYTDTKRFTTGGADQIIHLENIQVKLPNCPGNQDGSITITPEGGTAPYMINWKDELDGETGNTVSGLAAGQYETEITDANDHIQSFLIDLNDPDDITADITQTVGLEVVLNEIDGGTAPYTFVWDNGITESPSFLNGGTHELYVTDVHGCTDTTTITILEVLVNLQHNICSGDQDGQIIITDILGGAEPYDLQWSKEFEPISNLDHLSGGMYVLNITDDNGAKAMYHYQVDEPEPFIIDVFTYNSTTQLHAEGGTPPYTILWSSGQVNETMVNNLPSGSYTVYIIDSVNCQAELTFDLTDTGIDDISQLGWALYPNPNVGTALHLQTTHALKNLQVKIYNIVGQELWSKIFDDNAQRFILEPGLLSAGIYHIIFSSEGQSYQTNLVISR